MKYYTEKSAIQFINRNLSGYVIARIVNDSKANNNVTQSRKNTLIYVII